MVLMYKVLKIQGAIVIVNVWSLDL